MWRLFILNISFFHYCHNTTGEVRFRMQEHLLIEMTPHFKVPTPTKRHPT